MVCYESITVQIIFKITKTNNDRVYLYSFSEIHVDVLKILLWVIQMIVHCETTYSFSFYMTT